MVNQRFTVIHINNSNNNPCLNYKVNGVDVEVSVQGKDLGVINHIIFHLTSLRRILKIKWFFHVSNEEVLGRAGIKSIETFIGSARLRWYGQVARMPETRLPNFLLDWKPNYGKKLRGRPRKGWMACVLKDAAVFTGVDNISRDAVKQLALKRVEWRNMLHRRRDVCDAGHSND